ncbi:hydroxymethylbilane synthase [Rothia nasisuis]|uniref:hydroxymethylbilane synthase n=1 Tax=Rothia nasisuis TaxID=2109647 RepID=UPI001F026EA8|nr:hydroxymethylbilane synthase [Rothia nasisuis]
MAARTFFVGTRGSALATTQTAWAAQRMREATGIELETVTVKTEGDVLTGPLSQLGGTGVFAATLRSRLLDGGVDIAVHSLKDLPSAPCPGLTVAATPEREDPRDALCARDGLTLETLPQGARVGTGSPRRAAQLLALRPDVTIVDIRGNVGTRLARVPGKERYGVGAHGLYGEKKLGALTGDCDAVVLAAAGLHRLGLEETITEYLSVEQVVPAPGQGALAIEIRTGDTAESSELGAAVAAVNHTETQLAVTAERALLRRLEAGCAAPIGAYAYLVAGQLILTVAVASPDGTELLRHTVETETLSPESAAFLGTRAAEDVLGMGATALAGLGTEGGEE